MSEPDRISSGDVWRRGRGIDPAKYLISPGSVSAPGKHSAGMLRHARPYIVNGRSIFVFPVGTEGFRRQGTATLGLHKYIGDNTVDGVTTHYEEGRITLTGTFPGLTAQDCMVACINVLRTPTPDKGLILYAPGVFEREQYVLAESWDFDHDPEDRTHSIAYEITLVRIGEGRSVSDPHGAAPPPQPVAGSTTKGKAARIFVARDGAQTLRAIASIVYGDAAKWNQIVVLNATTASPLINLPSYQIPTYRWPIGTEFKY